MRSQEVAQLGGRDCRAEQIALHLGAAENVQRSSRCCSVSTPSAVVVMSLAAAMCHHRLDDRGRGAGPAEVA